MLKKKDRYYWALVCLIGFHIIGNVLWIRLNKLPPSWDAAIHTVASMDHLDYLRGGLANFNLHEFLTIRSYYPPFMYYVGALLALIGGFKADAIRFSGTIFLAIGIVFVYLCAEELFKSKRSAFFSAFFFSFFTYVYKESRDHMLDVPLTAVLVSGLYFLLKSKNFTREKYTLLFFLAVAVAMMIKWVAVVYFVFPVMGTVISILRKNFFGTKQLISIGQGLFVGAVIVLPWYLTNYQSIVSYGSYFSQGTSYSPQELFSVSNIFFYFKLLVIFLLTTVGFGYFLFGAITIFSDSSNRGNRWLVAYIVVYYLLFTFIHNKAVRYLIPIMPFFALVAGYAVDWSFRKRNKIFAAVSILVVLYYILSYSVLSFGIPFSPRYKIAVNFPAIGWLDLYYFDTHPVRILYAREDWLNNQIAKVILMEVGAAERKRLLVVSDKEYLSAATINLSLYEQSQSKPENIEEVDTNYNLILQGEKVFPSEESLRDYLSTADYVVVTEKEVGPKEALFDIEARVQIKEYILNLGRRDFSVIYRASLPDGDAVYIFKKNYIESQLTAAYPRL